MLFSPSTREPVLTVGQLFLCGRRRGAKPRFPAAQIGNFLWRIA